MSIANTSRSSPSYIEDVRGLEIILFSISLSSNGIIGWWKSYRAGRVDGCRTIYTPCLSGSGLI